MSRFNTSTLSAGHVARQPDTRNLSGGEAWAQDAELELASLITTSMVTDKFYRSANAELDRMIELISQVDPYFAAQAAVYARTTDGLRSITHAVAAEIGHAVKGEQWTKRFFNAVVRRPDDITEILSYYLAKYGKPIPNSMKKGLSFAFGKFDAYQLAKYRGENQGLSLVDAVNLVRPKATKRQGAVYNRKTGRWENGAIGDLVGGTLRSTDTFESKLSAAGPSKEAKEEAWQDLLRDGRIGYMALLKNLRNIATQAPALVPRACELLTDPERVAKSLVLPFRYMTALHQLEGHPQILAALSQAVDLSLVNVPDLGQSVLVAVDGSGSMGGPVAGNEEMTRKGVASLFAAALYKKTFADVAVFGSTCGPVRGLNPADSTLTNADKIFRTCYGHSTNFQSIFETAARGHDTVVIFSDMQANVDGYSYGYSHPGGAFASYKSKFKVNPHVFAFDLAGHGSAQFPKNNVYQLAGFSDKSLAMLAQFKQDPRALVNTIKAVEI